MRHLIALVAVCLAMCLAACTQDFDVFRPVGGDGNGDASTPRDAASSRDAATSKDAALDGGG